MAVSNNTCYEVVNISWLKSLVGSAVQNDSGQTVNVSEKSGTTYCPTYKELTDGTFIPYRSVSTDGPADDVDGITVNGTCYATGEAYAANQLVNKHDVAVCNTRLKEFSITIADASTAFDGCSGGTKNLSYTRTFTRNTWDMLSCSTQTESSQSSTDVDDTRNNLVSWTTNIGSITASTSAGSGKAVSVGKNKATSSSPSTRTITVTGSSTFRHSTSSTTASVTQNAVTGDWTFWYNVEENEKANGVEATTSTAWNCYGGTYGGRAKYTYDVRTYYKWKDTCSTPEIYDDITTSQVTSTGNNGVCKGKTGTFTNVKSSGIQGGSKTATLTWDGETQGSATWGSSDVITYTQTCAVPTGCDTSTSHTYSTVSSTKDVNCTDQDVAFSVSMPHTATTHYYDDYNACQTSTTANTVTATASVHVNRNTGDAATYTSSVSASPGGTISYTINQEGGCTNCQSYTSYTDADVTYSETVPCTGATVPSLTGNVTYTAYTVTPSGTGCSTSSAETTYTAETGSITIGQNESTASTTHTGTINHIKYTINQEGCAQCEEGTIYAKGGLSTASGTCGCLEQDISLTSADIPYSAYSVAADCSQTFIESGFTSYTFDFHVDANNTSEERTVQERVVIAYPGDEYRLGLAIFVTVKQSACTTPCDSIDGYYTGRWASYDLSYQGGNDFDVAYITTGGSYSNFNVELDGEYDFVSNPQITSRTGGPGANDGRRVAVDMLANNTSSTRNFKLKVTANSGTNVCTQVLEFTQAAKPASTCNCNSVTLTGCYQPIEFTTPECGKLNIRTIAACNGSSDNVEWGYMNGSTPVRVDTVLAGNLMNDGITVSYGAGSHRFYYKYVNNTSATGTTDLTIKRCGSYSQYSINLSADTLSGTFKPGDYVLYITNGAVGNTSDANDLRTKGTPFIGGSKSGRIGTLSAFKNGSSCTDKSITLSSILNYYGVSGWVGGRPLQENVEYNVVAVQADTSTTNPFYQNFTAKLKVNRDDMTCADKTYVV